MPPSPALISVPTRVRSNQTTVLLRRMPGRLRAARAISGRAPFPQAIGHRQFGSKGFQQPEIDIEADRDDAGFDIRDRRLRGAGGFGQLLLGDPPRTPPGAKDARGLAKAADGVGCGIFHAMRIAQGRYSRNIGYRLFCRKIAQRLYNEKIVQGR